MNSFLLNRALGTISPHALAKAQNTRLVYALQPSNDVAFSIKRPDDVSQSHPDRDPVARGNVAHSAGVSEQYRY
jgi:DNA excision repair protein ERCC-8